MSGGSVRWGVLGASWIGDIALLPALRQASGAELHAIAARDQARARAAAERHGVPRVHEDYAALLADPDVDAVYLPLPNSLHLPWTQRALAAGKHVLCEKPLALNATEALEMADAAERAGRLLMEAAMYRFHPRMRALVASLAGAQVRHVSASFAFTIDKPDNYRMRPEYGGGALLDVGFYVADVARWLLGEPERVEAVIHGAAVDMSCSALLSFPGGAQASLFASFEAAEHQELVVVGADRVERVTQPFTGWDDPLEQYRLMVEEFSAAVLAAGPAPLPLESSIANLRLLDRIRDAAG
ncbi:MAG TPA: Gfo/Idh/MocA family oxidoreductase [Candidatus Dormibacteraeota bacterium]|nr:Gfo/Idh/MocA family oxidoreductase [Candidatus Dormibacteraeota bacterium]